MRRSVITRGKLLIEPEEIKRLGKELSDDARKFVRGNKGLKITSKIAYPSPRITAEFMDCSMPMTFDHYSACSLGCIYCQVGGTKISTPSGKKNVEDIMTGDKVYCRDLETGRVEIDEVVSVMERTAKKVYEIVLEDERVIEFTGEHPIWVNGYGWKKVKDLKVDDDVDAMKSPHQSYRFSHGDNPMQNNPIAKIKQRRTLKKSYSSGDLDWLKEKLADAGRKNLIKYNKLPSTRKMVFKRMKNNNPMKDPDVAKKVSRRMIVGYRTGRIIPTWKGKEKVDARIRMLNDNPMKDPELAKKAMMTRVAGLKERGGISLGELKVKNALSEMGLNFIHQFVVYGDKSYVLDFLLPDNGVCVEYDWYYRHYIKRGIVHDLMRDKWLSSNLGLRTVRVRDRYGKLTVPEIKSFLQGRI